MAASAPGRRDLLAIPALAPGDSTQRIDWHKSALSEHIFARTNGGGEHALLWACPRIDALSLAASDDAIAPAGRTGHGLFAVRAHERVAALGSPFVPGHSRTALVRMATWMLDHASDNGLPEHVRLPRFSTVLLLGDFLERPEAIAASASALAAEGVTGHMVQVVDPAEETLPYAGRIEFRAMTGSATFLAGKTDRCSPSGKVRPARSVAKSLAASVDIHHPPH
jgi:uncharacterized protein (DUF58 family)